ncbi:hypothetical protein KK120_18705 [Virgibacillus dakarensis]|nr:hypothetical protein [Virgibacillus dakarensis]
MKNTFKESEVQKRTHYNKFEEELREWAKVYQELYGYEILDGTVSDIEGELSREQHNSAKLSKGDIGFKFGSVEFYISQKMARKNNYGVIVPSRVYKNVDSLKYKKIWKNKLDYFILDSNEPKEIRNKRGFEYLIYFDENTGEYYLYCQNDILNFKFSERYNEPEGGFLNLNNKYKAASFHEKMTKEEGETKMKFVLQRTFLKFPSLEECMQWFFDFIVKPALFIHEKQQQEIVDKKYDEYREQIAEWVEEHKDLFIYKPLIADSRIIINAKQDVLTRVQETQKGVYNDQVDFEYDLYSYKLLKLRDKFDSTKEFMSYLFGKYIPEEMQQEAQLRLDSYKVNGALPQTITIVPPSTFKCKGATRKEAIICRVSYEVGRLKLLKNQR